MMESRVPRELVSSPLDGVDGVAIVCIKSMELELLSGTDNSDEQPDEVAGGVGGNSGFSLAGKHLLFLIAFFNNFLALRYIASLIT